VPTTDRGRPPPIHRTTSRRPRPTTRSLYRLGTGRNTRRQPSWSDRPRRDRLPVAAGDAGATTRLSVAQRRRLCRSDRTGASSPRPRPVSVLAGRVAAKIVDLPAPGQVVLRAALGVRLPSALRTGGGYALGRREHRRVTATSQLWFFAVACWVIVRIGSLSGISSAAGGWRTSGDRAGLSYWHRDPVRSTAARCVILAAGEAVRRPRCRR